MEYRFKKSYFFYFFNSSIL